MTGLSVAVEGSAGRFPIAVAFEAGPGITALFGPSGAGKSSVLKMIAGTLRPRSGRIAIGGRVLFDGARRIDLPPPYRQAGFVFQDGRLFPHLSVRRNLTYARWAGGRKVSRAFDEVVALLGIEPLLERAPDTLSGGERQRVAIGRALLADPSLLLMDEPLSSLDHARRQEILPYLETIRAETRIPIVYVSHELEEVARLADTLVLMEGGRVTAAGPARELFSRLDLAPHLGGGEGGVVLKGEVVRLDPDFGLAVVAIGGGEIELVAEQLFVGDRVRLRVRARDVAISLVRPEGISVRNVLAATVEGIAAGPGPHVDTVLLCGAQRLRSRITRRSAVDLGLAPGQPVFALLKAVSVERGQR